MIIKIPAPSDTQKVAIALANLLENKKALITLEGDLGTGKTTFSQFFLQALGVSGTIPSPTYAIVNEYQHNHRHFVHADFYRLEEQDSLDLLGFDFLLQTADIVLIEWPKFNLEPDIHIALSDQPHRTLTITAEDELINHLNDLL